MDDSQSQVAVRLQQSGTQVTAAVAVQRSAGDIYSTWSRVENLPRFIDPLISVQTLDGNKSRWIMRGPLGAKYMWTALTINDVPGQQISWITEESADILSSGTITFLELPFQRGTQVRIVLRFIAPGGQFGVAVGKQLGIDVLDHVRLALFRLRQVMEANEVAVNKGQPAGANPFREDRPGEADRRATESDLSGIAPGRAD